MISPQRGSNVLKAEIVSAGNIKSQIKKCVSAAGNTGCDFYVLTVLFRSKKGDSMLLGTLFALIILHFWCWIAPVLGIILFFILMKSFFAEVFGEIVKFFSC